AFRIARIREQVASRICCRGDDVWSEEIVGRPSAGTFELEVVVKNGAISHWLRWLRGNYRQMKKLADVPGRCQIAGPLAGGVVNHETNVARFAERYPNRDRLRLDASNHWAREDERQ